MPARPNKDTDWPQIAGLYEALRISPSPVIEPAMLPWSRWSTARNARSTDRRAGGAAG
jgi:hypothetical protein